VQKGLQQGVLRSFRLAVQLIFNLAILALLLGLLIGVGRTLLELGLTLSEPSVRLGLKDLITNVLSLVVMLELVRAFVEYFEYERIRPSSPWPLTRSSWTTTRCWDRWTPNWASIRRPRC
jgi:hypothetical protein